MSAMWAEKEPVEKESEGEQRKEKEKKKEKWMEAEIRQAEIGETPGHNSGEKRI